MTLTDIAERAKTSTEAEARARRQAGVTAAILRGQLRGIVVELNEVIRLLETEPMHADWALRDAEFAARCLNDALQLAREQGL